MKRVLGYTPLESGLAFLPALGAWEVPLIGLVMAVAGMLVPPADT